VHYPTTQGVLPTNTKEEEKAYLEETIKELEQEIKGIRAKIKDLTEEK
jgi:hypothetical protein